MGNAGVHKLYTRPGSYSCMLLDVLGSIGMNLDEFEWAFPSKLQLKQTLELSPNVYAGGLSSADSAGRNINIIILKVSGMPNECRVVRNRHRIIIKARS